MLGALPHLGGALATLANGWTAFSGLATLAGAGGIVLVVLMLVLGAYVPGFIRKPLIAAGVAVLVGAALFQAGQARGAHQAFARDQARALAAEQKRADLAEAITTQDRRAAAADLAEERARSAKLQEMLDALAKDPDRDRVCTTRDDARRLRDL